jgi:Lon protease-like protein
MAGCRVSDLDPATIPGFREARAALDGLTEGTMSADDVDRIVAVVMGISRPYVQAELLADVSDYLTEQGHHDLASLLDNLSAGIQKAVYGG